MAELMTLSEVSLGRDATCRIAIEDDASPIVRLVGRTLGDAIRAGHAPDIFGECTGTVVVRSHDTPQAATLVFAAGKIEVSSGAPPIADATVVVDLLRRFAPVQEPTGDIALAGGTLRALSPPLPYWREAAEQFWEATRDIPGIPDVLIALADGPDGRQRARFGEGATEYLISGPEDVLAGVFTGADDFLAALSTGLGIKGTLSQMSVMVAASWRVRFDV